MPGASLIPAHGTNPYDAQFKALWNAEHNDDGTQHTPISWSASGTGNGSGVASRFFYFDITADDVVQGNPPGTGTKVEGFALEHHYGGSATKGGRNSLVSYSFLDSPTSSTNTDRNYVGVEAVFTANSGDGGTLPASPKGAGFALSTLAHIKNAATGFLNTTAGDFELVVEPSATCQIQTGIQVGGSVGANGTVVDAAVFLGAGTGWGFSPTGWLNGIYIGYETGAPALASTATVLSVRGHSTLANAFDFSGTTFTGFLISSNDFSISAPDGNHTIQMGRQDGSTSSPFIDMHSHGTLGSPDARIIATGGTGTDLQGTLAVETGNFQVSGQLTSATTLQVLAPSGQSSTLQTWYVNAVPLLNVLADGRLQTSSGNESTGAGSALLGANSPASTLTAPYKWLKFASSDGSAVWVPAWK